MSRENTKNTAETAENNDSLDARERAALEQTTTAMAMETAQSAILEHYSKVFVNTRRQLISPLFWWLLKRFLRC